VRPPANARESDACLAAQTPRLPAGRKLSRVAARSDPLLPPNVGQRMALQARLRAAAGACCALALSHACARAAGAAQGIVALHLSWDETLLAVHHDKGVDVHAVGNLMMGRHRPLRTHCAGAPPRQFEWCERSRPPASTRRF
jgi:hypothetical protein